MFHATLSSFDTYLSSNSENQVVTRGIKAIGLIYHLTGRVPALIKQSHLEENEGNHRFSDMSIATNF